MSSQSPTRVAFCITELDPGGAERALFEIVTRLDSREWEPRVYCLGPETELAREFVARGVPVVCLGAKGLWQVGGVLRRLVREWREFRPAVLQTFLFHANVLGRLAGWWAGVPVIVSGLRVAERAQRWHRVLDRVTQRFVRWHVCVSEGVRQFAAESGLRPDRLVVIPNGIDAEKFSSAAPADLRPLGVPDGAWTVVTVGRLTDQKGQADLIRAMSPLMATDQLLHLLIVGEGPLRTDLERLAAELRVADRVHLPGRQKDVPGILKASQAFALPSYWEGMPNALLEALAAGLPCVATAVEGVDELLKDCQPWELVAPGDVAALQLAVRRLRERLPNNPNDIPQDDCGKYVTWDGVSRQYAELYRQSLAERANSPGR